MQYLFIGENNFMEMKNSEEIGFPNVGSLFLEDNTYFTVPKWYGKHIRVVRDRASKMLRKNIPVKEVHQFIHQESQKVKLRRKGYCQSFSVLRIPYQYTGGRHLCIAFQLNKWCPPQYGNCLSPIISLCLYQSLQGSKGRKEAKEFTLSAMYYGYKGKAIIYDDWTIPTDRKGREFPITFAVGDYKYKASKKTVVDGQVFHMVFQACQQYFHIQHQIKQMREAKINQGKQKLFKWLPQQEDIEQDYKETLKRFILPFCDKEETFTIVKNKILQWQEDDKQGREERKPAKEMWWFKASVQDGGFLWEKEEEEKEEKEEKEKEEMVINPETGRKIKVGGAVYLKLKQKGFF